MKVMLSVFIYAPDSTLIRYTGGSILLKMQTKGIHEAPPSLLAVIILTCTCGTYPSCKRSVDILGSCGPELFTNSLILKVSSVKHQSATM